LLDSARTIIRFFPASNTIPRRLEKRGRVKLEPSDEVVPVPTNLRRRRDCTEEDFDLGEVAVVAVRKGVRLGDVENFGRELGEDGVHLLLERERRGGGKGEGPRAAAGAGRAERGGDDARRIELFFLDVAEVDVDILERDLAPELTERLVAADGRQSETA
jgi:hypothetical protein